METQFISSKKEETLAYGEKLGSILEKPEVILFTGDLGAGKTTFIQGLAKGLGITRKINSPTFNILKIYKGRLPLYHIDAYRLEGLRQDLGFEEYLEDTDGIAAVEWPEYISYLLPGERIEISISINEENQRIFDIKTTGEKENEIVKRWLNL